MDKELRTYLLYFGMILFCFIFGGIAEKRNNKKIVFIIAVLMSLPMGWRKNTVGIDSNNYYWMIEGVKKISDAFRYSDPLFYAYSYIIKMFGGGDTYFVYFVYSFICNFLVIYRLWDYKDKACFKYGLLRYITLFYFFGINCMRQFLAISIVFYANKYVQKGKYTRFALWVLFASTIHLSAFMSFLYLALEYIRKDELTQKQRNFAALSFLALPITVVLTFFVSRGRYESYFEEMRVFRSSSVVLKFAIFIIAFIYMYLQKRFTKKNYDEFMCFLYYFIGLIFNTIGVFFPLIERTGYYFYLYATVYLGVIANNKDNTLIIRLIIIFIVIRSFYLNCLTNSMGQMPYLFNWE